MVLAAVARVSNLSSRRISWEYHGDIMATVLVMICFKGTSTGNGAPYSPIKFWWFPANFPGISRFPSWRLKRNREHWGTRDPPWPTNMWLEDNHPYLYPNPQYIRQCHEVWNFISRYISTQYTQYCWWYIYIYSSISTYVAYTSKHVVAQKSVIHNSVE